MFKAIWKDPDGWFRERIFLDRGEAQSFLRGKASPIGIQIWREWRWN